MSTIALDTQIRCVQRELALRKRTYPRLVAHGKMASPLAAREILVMEEVLATLQTLRPRQAPLFPEEAPHADPPD